MVEVIATSDLHGALPEIPACDLLVIAGDVCPVANHDRAFQARWLREDFSAWLDECLNNKVSYIVWTAGNHDFVLEESKKVSLEMKRFSQRVFYLIDEAIDLEGVNIYCTPWTPHLPTWAYAAEEGEAAEAKTSLIPYELDILVSHGPPIGSGDYVCGAGHVGSPELKDAVVVKKPKHIVCGHIHEGFGHYYKEYTDVWNVSYLDEFYEPTHELVELEL